MSRSAVIVAALRLPVGKALLVPVRDLHADEHAEHDDHELDCDGHPLLVPEMSDQATQDHGSLTPLMLVGRRPGRDE